MNISDNNPEAWDTCPVSIHLSYEEAEALLWLMQQTHKSLDETTNQVRDAIIFDLSVITQEHHSQ